ncbi:MAG TPA: bifunctional molybdenum cofactor biosynthesis protein MoaC/MoaB [Frankiaceae bacterium]|jgi:cyclic pyranopterin phosphate synthase|nr:bifunctional molybdenum cofactor biosynthesis protein MoaC/MoaB [Frankiaceae bacterium]
MTEGTPGRLTHVDERGAARMVDVGGKEVTARVAVAAGRLLVSPAVIELLRGDGVPKGDALGVARVAGILAAKRTPDLVPLCHPLPISGVEVDLELSDGAVEIRARVKTTGRTGVEMEALTSVAVAGLTLHDMVKAVDPGAVLTDVRVLSKSGGRSGDWERGDPPEHHRAEPSSTAAAHVAGVTPGLPSGALARVLTISDRAHGGVRADASGPLLAGLLADIGFLVDGVTVVPDEADVVANALREAVAAGIDLVVTTGGTGFSPRDVTPEATRRVITREAPGLVEMLRAADRERVPTSILSRAVAGIAGGSVIVNLPGSTGGVRDGVAVLAPVIGHAIAQVRGGGDHG